jgi:rubrerythrin
MRSSGLALRKMSEQQPKPKITLAVYRCGQCGDTFPAAVEAGGATCPSCGANSVELASEPLL